MVLIHRKGCVAGRLEHGIGSRLGGLRKLVGVGMGGVEVLR